LVVSLKPVIRRCKALYIVLRLLRVNATIVATRKSIVAMENMAKKVTRKFLLNIASIIVFSGSPESKVPIKPPAVQPETKAKEESVEVSKTRGQGVFLYSSRTERLTGISLSLKSKTTGHMVKIVKKATKKSAMPIASPYKLTYVAIIDEIFIDSPRTKIFLPF